MRIRKIASRSWEAIWLSYVDSLFAACVEKEDGVGVFGVLLPEGDEPFGGFELFLKKGTLLVVLTLKESALNPKGA